MVGHHFRIDQLPELAADPVIKPACFLDIGDHPLGSFLPQPGDLRDLHLVNQADMVRLRSDDYIRRVDLQPQFREGCPGDIN